jgi:hypothetical protein
MKRLALFAYCLAGFRFDWTDVRNAWHNAKPCGTSWRGIGELWAWELRQRGIL